MAVSNKWAVLPDIDAAPEVYETPDLADDVSTAQTGTLRTISESPSDDEALPGLDRQPLDRDEARRRFEPALVDARGVDFSDSIGGSRRSYRTRSRRRRRRQDGGGEELGDLSDSEEETLGRKLARLKREAEEVRLELERREQDKDKDKDKDGDGEFKDSVEQQQQQQQDLRGADDDHDHIDSDGVEQLTRVLDQLSTRTGIKTGGAACTLENEFLSKVDTLRRRGAPDTQSSTTPTTQQQDNPSAPTSALSAVAAFSDRLTALEASLGISSTRANSQASIIPTLDSLSKQIAVLSNTLTPGSRSASGSSTTVTANQSAPPALLETVASKLRTLIAESDRLTASRKQALQALSELHEARMRNLMSHTSTRPRRGYSNASSTQQQQQQPTGGPDAPAPAQQADESLQIQSQLFLDEQSSKITALYQLLPSIQNLQPLLPVVLERLRALSIVHAGAADAKNTLDAVEKRQAETREEIAQWRQAVEDVEKRMAELEDAMKGNVKVVGDMVAGIEGRMSRWQKGQ
ncbi:hypothetical protein PV08_00680 [Exophiala spinifera]|uniref:Dynactin subunit n=1 Tax=Exophiala spinifera TaxID=91928 RepID=A0A0D2BNJ8_9EURO|nr:uncharacterized protein PV08_00680 [Exophiala spinifera]KIW20105.1 hypothetical protein PV08_00680 [Exophiala spinifera]